MQNPDSFDRIIHYMTALAEAPFKIGNHTITPNGILQVGPNALRSYTCPEGCGACCMKCSLIYHITDTPLEQYGPGLFRIPGVPDEHQLLYDIIETQVLVNGKTFYVYEDPQAHWSGDKCKYLGPTGRCGIYEYRPLPCRIELFKFSHRHEQGKSYARVTTPGRKWALKRVDGERGAQCELIDYDPKMTETHIRDLIIIKGWMDLMGIQNRAGKLIEYLQRGPGPDTWLITSMDHLASQS